MRTMIKLMLLIMLFTTACYFNSHYVRKAIVVSVTDNVVTVEDSTNNCWCFNDEGFVKGQKVKMLMHTNYTDDVITDDIIVNVKKF